MRLSVIIPVYNGGKTLSCCLQALCESTLQPAEIIVVDDSSADDSAAIARRFAVRVLTLTGGPSGPAAARNRGVAIATGDVLAFIDADIAVHADTLARIVQCLRAEPDIVALFGSYDTNPPVATLVSRYKNLMHHYVHQRSNTEASTFWTGCGAIYRDKFLAMGGLDESFITIEDIELGVRLRRAGQRIRLCHDLQVTHLKHWTFAGLLREDILRRAVPWTRLILRESHLPADLNVDAGSRVSALAAWVLLGCLVVGLWAPWLWLGAVVAAAVVVAINLELYRFFAKYGTMPFILGAIALHVLYLLYSSVTFAAIVAWEKVVGGSRLAR